MERSQREQSQAPTERSTPREITKVSSGAGIGLALGGLLDLQRIIGNAGTLQLMEGMPRKNSVARRLPRTLPNRPAIQRNYKITFEEPEHEMEEPVNPATAKIVSITGARDAKSISVEDHAPADVLQKAHTTANVVHNMLWKRALPGKTWLEAWQEVEKQLKFLKELLKEWLDDATLVSGVAALIRNQLPGLIQAQIDLCKAELTRDDVDLAKGIRGRRVLKPARWTNGSTTITSLMRSKMELILLLIS